MSVISSWTATPRRIEGALHTCAAFPDGRVGRRQLGSVLAPSSLRKGAEPTEPASVDEIVRECANLGGFELDGPDVVLTEEGRRALGGFRSWCSDLLLQPEAAARARQADFPRALVWLLTEDPRTGLRLDENQAERVTAVLGDPADLKNNDSFRQFLHWARFLGFAWWIPITTGVTRVIPDPTRAIRELLSELDLPRGRSVALADLIRELGRRCPVLEEGELRSSIEMARPEETRAGVAHRRLSASTGLALRRLEAEGLLRMVAESDASSLLLGPSVATTRRASHVVISVQ